MRHLTPAEYAALPWEHGRYEIATSGNGRRVEGFVCRPFAAHGKPFDALEEPTAWVLDHMPSGRAVAVLSSPMECERVARALVAATGGTKAWDFSEPKRLGAARKEVLRRAKDVIPAPALPHGPGFDGPAALDAAP